MAQHLIHIGYPKSGSTFLQEWFLQNPHLHYAPGGLAGFYNVYQLSQQAANPNNKNFQYFVTSDESLCIPQISTGTIPVLYETTENNITFSNIKAQDKNCTTLKSLFPNAKILFITRGFESLLKSGYSQLIRTGYTYDFEQHIRAFDFEDNPKNRDKSLNIDYTFMIHLYEQAFGKENVIILPYEMLRDHQGLFLKEIEQRLSLEHFDCHIGRINESLSPEELYWYPKISSLVSRFTQVLGQRAHTKIYRWYVTKVFKNDFKGMIRLLNKFKKGSQDLQKVDLSEFLSSIRENNTHRFAARLREEASYAPYWAEYLLDEEEHE